MSESLNLKSPAQEQLRWCGNLIREAWASGVGHFFICPGSRSAPLATACAALCPDNYTMHYDERGAGFAALGFGKSSRYPAAVITTSGTAVANLLPAVVEAKQAQIPLLLITADRPMEMIDCGANQTCDQTRLIRDYCEWFFDIPPWSCSFSEQALFTTVAEAVMCCVRTGGGAVHLNVRLVDPLLCDNMDDFKPLDILPKSYVRYELLESSELNSLINYLEDNHWRDRVSLVVCGAVASQGEMAAMSSLIYSLQKPVYLDICSGLRGRFAHTADETALKKAAKSGLVLRFGGRLVNEKLERIFEDCEVLRISGGRRRENVFHQKITCLETGLLRSFYDLTISSKLEAPRWQLPEDDTRLSGPLVVNLLEANFPAGGNLFIGNSLVIRDFDQHWTGFGCADEIFANRGVSGIDGNIATAIGIALDSSGVTVAVIGDQATLHDLNSLGLLKQVSAEKHPLKLVIINNGGGKIFEKLGHTSRTKNKNLFIGLKMEDFSDASRLFGLDYYSATNVGTARDILSTQLHSPKHVVIELRTAE